MILKGYFSLIISMKKQSYFVKILFSNIITNLFDLMTLLSLPLAFSILLNEDGQTFFNIQVLPKDIKIVLLIVIILFFIRLLLLVLNSKLNASFTWSLTRILNDEVFNIYLNYPFQQFQQKKISRLVRDVTGEVTAISQVSISVLSLFFESVVLLIVFIGLTIYDFKLSLILAVIFIINFIFINKVISNKISQYGLLRVNTERKMYDISTGSFIGLKEIISSELQSYYLKLFSAESKKREIACSNHLLFSLIPKPILEFSIVFTLVIIIYFFLAIYKVDINEIIVLFASLTAIAFRVLPGISKLITSVQNLNFNEKTLNHYVQIINEKEIESINYINHDSNELIVSINDILFNYDGFEKHFEISHLNINNGDFIGFKGESGSGKSTIMSLILGLYKPKSGKITFNKKITKISDIGYVDQQVQILEESLIYNITLSENNNESIKLKVLNLIQKVGLSKFFKEDCKEDFNYKLKLFGNNISGGQAQRIGIARALYKNPTLLVLDEITSALDSTTEKLIISTLIDIRCDTTMLLISHSEKTLINCDKIVTIKNGKVCI